MSGSLVSPGVKVSIIDQSAYGTSGPGTVPLIVIATGANKLTPGSTTAIAPGTLPSNAGNLYLITSQRDALQTFGNPTFYSAAGSVQFDNQLNELGLFTLYTYLGVATNAYVIRADVDLDQLIPTTVAPTGPTADGTYWLDLATTTWGIFQSNGNINPAYSWQSQTPLVIADSAKLEGIVQGYSVHNGPITSGSTGCITSAGTLTINGINVSLAAGSSLSQVVSAINSNSRVQMLGISAVPFIRQGKYSKTATANGDIFNLRLISSDYTQTITLAGSTTSILLDLGFSDPTGTTAEPDPLNSVFPTTAFGTAGNYAVNTLMDAQGNYSNAVFQMITVVTSTATTNWWFQVGTTESEDLGYSWQAAVPTKLIGSKSFNSISTAIFSDSETCTIQIGTGSPLSVSVTSLDTLQTFVAAINSQLNSPGTNAIAGISTSGGLNYLTITNYDASQIVLHDLVNQNGTNTSITPWATVGLSSGNTYWASVTGTVSNPTYTAATLLTTSATANSLGTGYLVNDPLTVVGGTNTVPTVLTVTTVQAVSAAINYGGMNYANTNTLTFGTVGADWVVPLILTVRSNSGGLITEVEITQPGQYKGATPPTTAVAQTTTNGSGTGATFNFVWGVDTVTVSTPGNYTVYPNPAVNVAVTGGNGNGATFNLTSGFLSSDSFAITLPGLTPVIVNVPASTSPSIAYATLSQVVAAINNCSIGSANQGPITASISTSNQLVITNTNGTAFTLTDYRGRPLFTNSGIASGVTFARQMVYQGYQPTLQPPASLSAIAANNVWINTTSGGLGANMVVKKYSSGEWLVENTTPNTGTVPLYSTPGAADTAFGVLKAIGSIFGQYNYYGESPATANITLLRWDGAEWAPLNYVPSLLAPKGPPTNGTLWYNTQLQVDIMVNNGQEWLGYKNMYPGTDPNGPILSSATPSTQSTGAPLVDYDIWVNTDIVPYPAIYRYNATNASWGQIDNTDHVDSAGIIFADARATANGMSDGPTAPSAMVQSNWVDSDAPEALLYAPYILLFNTRYSTYNVKQWVVNYFPQNYGTMYPTDTWVTFSGNAPDGTPYMGSAAQRAVVVDALNAALVASTDARAEQNYFNLISTPGYPECIAEMLNLNIDKNNVAFVIGDTPSTLQPTGTSIQNWATNAANAATNSDKGLVTHSSYLGLWYPWGLTADLQGNNVVVPPSLIALTTIAYSDSVSYPWFAPAGFNRGLVSAVSSVGYLDASGNYVPVILNQGQRDVLYTNDINPVAYMPGRGLVVWGQKTLDPVATALDRINVARLCCYLSYNLNNLAQPFLFEQNDTTTRAQVTAVFTSYLQSLVGLRALYDFSVVCNSSNNTPATIDANQLWIDVAIQPEIAIEFIYIPVRVLATGAPLTKTA